MPYDLTRPGDLALPPGSARCPGPSTKDIILRDAVAAPAALTAEAYSFLGDADIPFARYTSQSFYDAEIEHMWSRTWQWACREEHIPNVGDYVVYDVGPYSVLVFRTAPDTIKAFVNSCPHRGMQFCDAGSSGSGKQFLRCPFHGMSWHLDGSLREIPCRWDFPHVNDETFRLTEVQSGTWGGFVFVNLDPSAPPLTEYLQVLPEHFAEWPLEDRYVSLHMEKILPGNWKMVVEGFLEAYHVLATHPEGLRTAGDANAQYDIFGTNVTRFVHTIGYPSPHLRKQLSEAELFAALGHDPKDLPDGVGARERHAQLTRERLGRRMGVDLSNVSTSPAARFDRIPPVSERLLLPRHRHSAGVSLQTARRGPHPARNPVAATGAGTRTASEAFAGDQTRHRRLVHERAGVRGHGSCLRARPGHREFQTPARGHQGVT